MSRRNLLLVAAVVLAIAGAAVAFLSDGQSNGGSSDNGSSTAALVAVFVAVFVAISSRKSKKNGGC